MLDLTNLVVIDTETSGTNPFVHDVLSVAFVPMTEVGPPLSVHIRHTDTYWTEYARLNFEKFSNDWSQRAVPPHEAVRQIQAYLSGIGAGKAMPVGHNIGFDLAFLKRLAFQAGAESIEHLDHRAVDTHTLLRLLYFKDQLPLSATTSDGAFKYFGIGIGTAERHTALGDALATKRLFEFILQEFGLAELEAFHGIHHSFGP